MTEEKIQPQVEGVPEVKPAGEVPQPTEPIEQLKLGAEKQPQAEAKPPEPEKTYTQEQWSKRESEKDTEVAQIKEQMMQQAMQAELLGKQRAETEAKTKDQKDVEEGTITQSEASQKEQARQQQRQQQQTMAQAQTTLRQMAQQTEQYGRVLAARDFGKEYELNEEQIAELLSDKDMKTPGDMRAKAANLALERTRGELKKSKEAPPNFDQGLSGGGEEKTPEKQLKERYPSMYKK